MKSGACHQSGRRRRPGDTAAPAAARRAARACAARAAELRLQPPEEARVDGLGEAVAQLEALLGRVARLDPLGARLDLPPRRARRRASTSQPSSPHAVMSDGSVAAVT